ncbi:MAG: 50S ribosomal protein L11 methyltransferase [Bacteroidetes bacterium]|nr:MAG: 50S ribosomal protein L11 methyltransferase [Bacteroidota bacterium]
MDYLELHIKPTPRDPWTEIIIADLADNGFESFVEDESGVLAYARVADVSVDQPFRNTILEAPVDFTFKYEQNIIQHQNWNAIWEADFQPVFVDEYCTILAPFHDQNIGQGLKVIIQPQMSFGTGHHQTTWMMTKMLFELKEIPSKVLDMGAGTGVLAIIAEKLGASEVLAVDIEDWSVENIVFNAGLNECKKIDARLGDIDCVTESGFGLILANINKNVLKSHMAHYAQKLNSAGILLLSGFFETDANELLDLASTYGLKENKRITKDEWCCLSLIKE